MTWNLTLCKETAAPQLYNTKLKTFHDITSWKTFSKVLTDETEKKMKQMNTLYNLIPWSYVEILHQRILVHLSTSASEKLV